VNTHILGASITRILQQLRHDPRTIGMLLVVPVVLMGLVYAMFAGAEPVTSNVLLIMLGLAVAIERCVLRPLVNQPDLILFMATIGLTYFLIGFGELVFGGNPKGMIASELYLPKGAIEFKTLGGFVTLQKIDDAIPQVGLVFDDQNAHGSDILPCAV